MNTDSLAQTYTVERLKQSGGRLLADLGATTSVAEARVRLMHGLAETLLQVVPAEDGWNAIAYWVVRDAGRALRSMIFERAERQAGFSVVEALRDIAAGVARPDLHPGFFAELTHIFDGVHGRAASAVGSLPRPAGLEGRAAALARSDELDRLWERVEEVMGRYPDGLQAASIERRDRRRRAVQEALGATDEQFADWNWQVGHLLLDSASLGRVVRLTDAERASIDRARAAGLPFAVTPYYASLMDDDLEAGRDRAIRAQVIPPADYVDAMRSDPDERRKAFDFMRETDTSPVDLVTRRYPAIVILKPFNTCPQICVYCQRNWEIDDAMVRDALASPASLQAAIAYIEAHPAIREVLVTGGDPLGLSDSDLLPILRRVAAIRHVDVVRIGTRTPVTVPSRITPALAAALGSLRDPGRREVSVVTHIEHPYEVTPDLVHAVDRLRRQGIGVYNQQVFSYFVSRRFESAALRMVLKRSGVDPYYTFLPKGKEETRAYRVPVARILQEQKEEARLLPGTRRTDEPVYNVPGLGKNYLRASQHRDLIGILPDGSRVYEYHPWEKNVAAREHYVGTDTPVLEYLERLRADGEDPAEYASIWYYY